jgi:hypothetical protein
LPPRARRRTVSRPTAQRSLSCCLPCVRVHAHEQVDCATHHRHLFATTATDGAVRLYSMLQATPLLRLEPASQVDNPQSVHCFPSRGAAGWFG